MGGLFTEFAWDLALEKLDLNLGFIPCAVDQDIISTICKH